MYIYDISSENEKYLILTCKENQNKFYIKTFFRKSFRLSDNEEKYGRAR
jgi:hypothetical protein